MAQATERTVLVNENPSTEDLSSTFWQLYKDLLVESYEVLPNVFPSIALALTKDWRSSWVSQSVSKANGLVISYSKVLEYLFFSAYLYISQLMIQQREIDLTVPAEERMGWVMQDGQRGMFCYAIITMIFMWVGGSVFQALGVPENERKVSSSYLWMVSPNAISHYLLGCYHQLNVAIRKPKVNTYGNALGAALGILLLVSVSAFFAHYKPDMGYVGIAASQLVGTSLYYYYLRRYTKDNEIYAPYRLFDNSSYHASARIKDIAYFMWRGFPIGLQKLTSWLHFLCIAVLISRHFSSNEVKAYTVVTSVFEMCFALVGGLLVGQAPALENKFKRLSEEYTNADAGTRRSLTVKFSFIFWALFFHNLMYAAVIGVLAYAGSESFWPWLFTKEPNAEINHYATQYLIYTAWVVPLQMVYTTSATIFRVLGSKYEDISVALGLLINVVGGVYFGNQLALEHSDSSFYFSTRLQSMGVLSAFLMSALVYVTLPSSIGRFIEYNNGAPHTESFNSVFQSCAGFFSWAYQPIVGGQQPGQQELAERGSSP